MERRINLHMFSKKNDNFSTFYSIVSTFAGVSNKAENARASIQKNQVALAGARKMLETNVLAVQRKIKAKRKLRQWG